MLSEQIQQIVNTTLRQLFATWKQQINSLNDKLPRLNTQLEEFQMVDSAISFYVSEMTK